MTKQEPNNWENEELGSAGPLKKSGLALRDAKNGYSPRFFRAPLRARFVGYEFAGLLLGFWCFCVCGYDVDGGADDGEGDDAAGVDESFLAVGYDGVADGAGE